MNWNCSAGQKASESGSQNNFLPRHKRTPFNELANQARWLTELHAGSKATARRIESRRGSAAKGSTALRRPGMANQLVEGENGRAEPRQPRLRVATGLSAKQCGPVSVP
jgi:hypothetical protein